MSDKPPDLWQAYETAVSLRDYTERLIADVEQLVREHDRLNVHRDATLREKIASLHELFKAEQDAATKAILKAEVANQRHFESINGLNDRLERQASTFPTRDYVDTRISGVVDQAVTENNRQDKRLSNLEHWRSGMEGRVVGINLVMGVIVVLISFALSFL